MSIFNKISDIPTKLFTFSDKSFINTMSKLDFILTKQEAA